MEIISENLKNDPVHMAIPSAANIDVSSVRERPPIYLENSLFTGKLHHEAGVFFFNI